MIDDRKKLYDYLIDNNYQLNPNECYHKESISILFFNDKKILIKDIEDNRKYYFDQQQSTKVIIGFLKYLEKSANIILV